MGGRFSYERELLECVQLSLILDGERVAYAQLHTLSETTIEVVDLFVKPECRGNGYGRAVLQEALEFARSSGYRHVCAHASADNEPAYRLFRDLGFHGDETEVHLELDF